MRLARDLLFRRYIKMANVLAFRLAPYRDEAEDLVQDAFIQAFGNLARLREPAAFPGWLRQIVVHIAANRLRSHRMRVRFGLARQPVVDFDALISPNAPPDVT